MLMKGGERKAVRGSSSTWLIDSTGNETNDAAMISALGGARDKRKQLRKASRTDRRGKQVHGRGHGATTSSFAKTTYTTRTSSFSVWREYFLSSCHADWLVWIELSVLNRTTVLHSLHIPLYAYIYKKVQEVS